MPQPKGQAGDVESQIAKRVSIVRNLSQLSQREFAQVLGVNRDRIANVEYGRTPLDVGLAEKIIQRFGVNLVWLATGADQMTPYIGLPSDLPIKISSSDPFSIVSKECEASAGLTNKRIQQWSCSGLMLNSIADKLRDIHEDSFDAFYKKLASAANDIFNSFPPQTPKDLLSSRLKRGVAIRSYLEKYHPELPSKKEIDLTDTASSEKLSGVKAQLPNLLERLNRATKESGKMSALAKFLDVPLASVSRWLSGKREPGGEITLKMLHWVEQQELQK